MNNATTPRRWTMVVMAFWALLVLAPNQKASAQCTLDPLAPYAPVPTFSLAVDAVFPGQADLNGSVISSFFNSDCGFLCPRFYTAQTGGIFLGSSVTLTCANVGSTFTYWVSVRDVATLCGAPSESPRRQIMVTIIDNTNPTVSCPANASVAADPGLCAATVPGLNPTTGDNCAVTKQTWTKTGATTATSPATGINSAGGTSFNVGVTTVTYTVSDASNNTATCSFTVTVTDNQVPTITCPANVTSNTDAGECAATLNIAGPTSGDNCAVTSTTWTAPGAIPASGSSPVTGVDFPEGVTTVTYTVTDAAANTATCSFSVTVTDNEDPVIVGTPANQPALGTSTGLATPGNLCDGSFTWNHPTITDNCAGPNILQMAISGTTVVANGPVTAGSPITQLFNLGLSTVTYTATDVNGETAVTTFSVTVVDNVAPVITPVPTPQNNNFSVTAGDCSKVVTYTRPSIGTVADCGPVTLSESFVSGPDPNVLTGTPPFPPAGGGNITVQFPAGTTVIRYTWQDNAGNMVSVDYTFFIDEDENPTALCQPGTITLPVDVTGNAVLTTAMVDAGSNDNCLGLTLALSQTSFTCANAPGGAFAVTLTATDAAANTATCNVMVDVVDNLPPQVQCPTNQSINSGANCQGTLTGVFAAHALPLSPLQYFDNCSAVTFSYQLNGVGAFTNFNGDLSTLPAFTTGSTSVTIKVKDNATPLQNEGTCSFNVSIADATGPTFNDAPANVPDNGSTVSLNTTLNGCGAFYTWVWPVATDACSNPVTTLLQSHQPGAFFPLGSTTVTYLAKDNIGNIGTYTFVVTVTDNQNPVAKCQNVTTQLNAGGNASVLSTAVDNASTDNCFFTLSPGSYTFDCNDLGANVVTLTATDVTGNTSTCTATITVQDLIAPQAMCHPSLTVVNLDANGQASLTALAVDGGSSDNCQASLQFTISVDGGAFGDPASFDCDDLGVHVITLLVTDGGGNTATCTRSITVQDLLAPTFTVPGPVTIQCTESIDPDVNPNLGEAGNADDNCDNAPVITYSDILNSGSCPNNYTITRIWTITDASNNTSTASQTITVQDVSAPVITLASTFDTNTDDATSCDGPLTVTLTGATVTDNCSAFSNLQITHTIDYPTQSFGFVDVLSPVPGASVGPNFPIGTTTVTFIVRDECNNTSTHTATIVVHDVHGPVFQPNYQTTCGKVVVLPNTSGACSNLYSWARASSVFSNVSDCLAFTVTENIDNPSVQAAVNASNPYNYNSPNFFNIFASAQFPVGITTVTYTATDAVGNTTTCAFTVEIEDTQAPALTCPPNQILAATCPTAQVPNYTNLVQVSDNCSGNVDLTQVYAPGTTLASIFAPNPPTGGNQFTITVTGDDGYNTTTCSFQVTLQDGQAPIPTLAQLPDIIDSCGTFIVDAPSALDPCNPAADTIYGTPSTPVGMFLPGTPPRYNLLVGNYVITWVYNDGNGNISTQTQNITVLNDTFPPVAICNPTLTLNLSVAGQGSITANQLNNGSYDPNDCGALTFAVLPASLFCTDLGQATVTLRVTDLKGNTATCTAAVTVNDITAPTLPAIPANITVQACDSIPLAANLIPFDVCDDSVQVVLTQVSNQDTVGLHLYNYTIIRTWVATDDSGNASTGTQVVTVSDTQAPVFSSSAPDTILVLTDPNRLTCDDTVSFTIFPYISDCATGLDLTITNNLNALGPNITGIYGVGTYSFVFTAKDISNNISKDTVVVIVRDVTPPTAVCINGVSAALQPSGTVTVMPLQFDNNSFDNCTPHANLNLRIQRLAPLGAAGSTITFGCSDADGVTQHPVKLYVKDQYGNESTCETYIVIQDNVDPTVTFCPADKTVVCTDALSTQSHGSAQATDNCPANVTVSFDDTVVPADSLSTACYLVERTWTATDLAGNTATCVQTFSVLDTVKPVLSAYPLNDTIACSEVLDPPSNITATDNCTDTVVVVFTADTINIASGPCGDYSYTIRRIRTATDDCGNTEVHERFITVTDHQAPQFLGMPDTITVFSANFPSNPNCVVPVTLNVSQYLTDCTPVDSMDVTNDAPFGNDALIASGNYPVGSYLVHFSATDACGNVGLDSVVILVIDNSIPVAICNANVNVSLGTNGEATLDADDIDLGSNDNCGIDSMYLSQSEFDCADLGLNSVTLVVVDNNGNTNSCTVNVNVTSNTTMGFTVTAQGTAESYFGADDGTLSATISGGGTGPFSFQWSNGALTANVNNVAAGTYIVTVTDNGTGCIATATATVGVGPKLNLIVGEVAGNQGDIVQVPVTVDQFIDINAFSFSLNVLNPGIGTVIGINNSNPLFALQTNLAGNSLGVLWIAPANQSVTLPNGTLLFNLSVQIGANAPVGATTPVNVTFSPTGIAFAQDSSGTPIQISMINIDNGSITVDSTVVDEIQIAGDVKTWKNPEVPTSVEKPVPNATVNLTGSVNDQVITPPAGTYLFDVPTGSNTTVDVSKITAGAAGVNVLDLLRIVNHIFGATFPSPYQWIAADVKKDNIVSLADYLIIQRLVLGTDQHLLNSPDWRFVPKSYVFPASGNPLVVPYPTTISHTPALMDFLDDDFVGVRMGDVNGDVNPTFTTSSSDDRFGSTETFRFRVDEQAVRAGEVISIPFKASDFTGRQAYQMTIAFDADVLELTDIQPGVLPGLKTDNFGTATLAEGQLTTLWVSREPVTLADDAVLFTLTFRSLRPTSALSQVLHAGSTPTPATAFDADGNSMKIDFEFMQPAGSQEAARFALYQNQPNPFRGTTTIGFRLPETSRAVLRVYNVAGQLVKTVVGQFDKGYNEIRFEQAELGTPGVYWYELETPANSDRKKMILMD